MQGRTHGGFLRFLETSRTCAGLKYVDVRTYYTCYAGLCAGEGMLMTSLALEVGVRQRQTS